MSWTVPVYALGGVIAAIWLFLEFRMRWPSLPDIPGPLPSNLLWGNEWELFSENNKGQQFLDWDKAYGAFYKLKFAFGMDCLVVRDPRAITHIFVNSPHIYQHHPSGRKMLQKMVGDGLITVDGEDHRRARRALQPAFIPAALRSYVEVFQKSAEKAKAAFDAQIDANGGTEAVIDVQDWSFRMGLDNIGIAGFSYDFDALSGRDSSLVRRLREMGGGGSPLPFFLITALARKLPFILDLPVGPAITMRHMKEILAGKSRALIGEAREDILKYGENAGENSGGANSVLKRLVRSEMTTKEPQRLNEDEIVAQASTMLFAGSETVSSSLTWALYILANHPSVQTRLRDSLSSLPDEPTYEQLSADASPYLEAFIKENHRLDFVLRDTSRFCYADDEVPLTYPFTTSDGRVLKSVPVKRGTYIIVPNVAINCNEALWGPTALEFRPERWLEGSLPDGVEEMKGLYNHLMVFGSGSKSCIGYQFAITEMKVALAYLVRHFEFAPSSIPIEPANYATFHRLRRADDHSLSTPLSR